MFYNNPKCKHLNITIIKIIITSIKVIIMGIQTILGRNENARKIFGKRELAILRKQLYGVALTQSEKNRLSRDIRRKFEVIGELAPFSDEFRLKKGAEIRKIIGETRDIILKSGFSRQIRRIILFGSAADNTLSLSSDIDIAVEFKKITKDDALKFKKEMLGKANDRIDVQIYNILPEKIRREIDEKGRVLYERTNKRQNKGYPERP